MLKRSSNPTKKQNNVQLFQTILCFALLFMTLVLLWFFYSRIRSFWSGNKFWCICYWKENLGIEEEIIQWHFLVCCFWKSELCLTFSDPSEVLTIRFYETSDIFIMLPSAKRHPKEGFSQQTFVLMKTFVFRLRLQKTSWWRRICSS